MPLYPESVEHRVLYLPNTFTILLLIYILYANLQEALLPPYFVNNALVCSIVELKYKNLKNILVFKFFFF